MAEADTSHGPVGVFGGKEYNLDDTKYILDKEEQGIPHTESTKDVDEARDIFNNLSYKQVDAELKRILTRIDLSDDQREVGKRCLERAQGLYFEDAREKGLFDEMDYALNNFCRSQETGPMFNSASGGALTRINQQMRSERVEVGLDSNVDSQAEYERFSGIRTAYWNNALDQLVVDINKRNGRKTRSLEPILGAWNLAEQRVKWKAEAEAAKDAAEAAAKLERERLERFIESLPTYQLSQNTGYVLFTSQEGDTRLSREFPQPLSSSEDDKPRVEKAIGMLEQGIRDYFTYVERVKYYSKSTVDLQAIQTEMGNLSYGIQKGKQDLNLDTSVAIREQKYVKGRFLMLAARRSGEGFKTKDMFQMLQIAGPEMKELFLILFKDQRGFISKILGNLEKDDGKVYRPDTYHDTEIDSLVDFCAENCSYLEAWKEMISKEVRGALKDSNPDLYDQVDRAGQMEMYINSELNNPSRNIVYVNQLKNRLIRNKIKVNRVDRLGDIQKLAQLKALHLAIEAQVEEDKDHQLSKNPNKPMTPEEISTVQKQLRENAKDSLEVAEHIIKSLNIDSRYGGVRLQKYQLDQNGELIKDSNGKPIPGEIIIFEREVLNNFQEMIDYILKPEMKRKPGSMWSDVDIRRWRSSLDKEFRFKPGIKKDLIDLLANRKDKRGSIQQKPKEEWGPPRTNFYLFFDPDQKLKHMESRTALEGERDEIPTQTGLNIQERLWEIYFEGTRLTREKMMRFYDRLDHDVRHPSDQKRLDPSIDYADAYYGEGGGFTVARRLQDLYSHTIHRNIGSPETYGEKSEGRFVAYGLLGLLETYFRDFAEEMGCWTVADLAKAFEDDWMIAADPLQWAQRGAEAESMRQRMIGIAEIANKIFKGVLNSAIVDPKSAYMEILNLNLKENSLEFMDPEKLYEHMKKVFEPTLDVLDGFESYLGAGNVTGNTRAPKYARTVLFAYVFTWFIENSLELQDKFGFYAPKFEELLRTTHPEYKDLKGVNRSVVGEFIKNNSMDAELFIFLLGPEYASRYFSQGMVSEVFGNQPEATNREPRPQRETGRRKGIFADWYK